MKTIMWKSSSARQRGQALARPMPDAKGDVTANVLSILNEVKLRGDKALREFSAKFDGVARKELRVSAEEVKAVAASVDPELRAAMKRAKANIEKFHKAEYPKTVKVQTMPGVNCALHWRPVETVGVYIPAGTAPLFSSVLMLVLPARIAGCERIVLCSPPQKDGKIHPAVLAAAQMCGVTDVFAIGGAQAIAAMAYGTETVPKVHKIFGPGNQYVMKAKQLVSQEPDGSAIDMPAGPSEVMVIANDTSHPDWVAADLLAQAEHDVLSQVILVTVDADFAERVKREVKAQLATLSRRVIAAQSIAGSRIIIVPDRAAAIEVANLYAPEHLIIHDVDAAAYLPKITHAGSVFLGAWAPESAGDYASGTNHVLPTYGHARAYGGVSVLSFMKSMTVQSLTRRGLQTLGATIVTMAEAEGLDAHANAVKIRIGTRV